MRSISRSESEPNSSELDDSEARGELLFMLRHKVRPDGREIGALVRWKAQQDHALRRLSGCVHKVPEILVLDEENPGWPGRDCGGRRRTCQCSDQWIDG